MLIWRQSCDSNFETYLTSNWQFCNFRHIFMAIQDRNFGEKIHKLSLPGTLSVTKPLNLLIVHRYTVSFNLLAKIPLIDS